MNTTHTEETPAVTTDRLVVVGRVTELTDTHVAVTYPALGGESTMTMDRKHIAETGSIGLSIPGTAYRVFSCTKAVCPTCNNEPSLRRSVTIDADDTRTVTVCDRCEGKGHITSFNTNESPVIEAEHSDLTESLVEGVLPATYAPAFASGLAGGRGGKTDAWDVQITPKPLMAMSPGGVIVPVQPAIIQHYNESYANADMPHGHPVGRPKTGTYATVQHREALGGFIDDFHARGLKATAWGTNRGQDAYVDVVLSENGSRQEVIDNLRAISAASGERFASNYRDGIQDPRSLIKFGIQLHHTFDGAFTIRGIAERVACLNGMVARDAQNLLRVQHKKGVMDAIDWTAYAPIITEAALNLYEDMMAVDRMNDLMLDYEDWESILLLAEQAGILSFPSVGQHNQLTGGRVFRAANQGWADPTQHWVSVGQDEGDIEGSLNHAYNVFTGIITHQVEANDVHGRVTGGKATGVARTQQMLQRVHGLFTTIQRNAEDAAREVGAPVAEYVMEHGIPMLRGVSHENAGEGHILPRITVNAGQDNERSVQLTSAFVAAQ